MLVKDILWSARFDYLDDAGDVKTADEWYAGSNHQPLWPDEALLRHLNTSLDEWCRETGCLRDHITEAICKIPILCNQSVYMMDSRITEIHNGYLEKGSPLVLPKSDTWLDENVWGWKRITGSVLWLLPDYDQGYLQTIYYPPSSMGYWTGAIGFTAISGTITQTGGNFSSLLVVGDKVVVSSTALNGTTATPKTFTVASVLTDSFTVSEALSDEAAPTAVMRKVIDTLWLTVSRLPLTPLTIGAIATQSPEIRSDYHSYLVHGICREAYSKQDSQTLDVSKAKDHEGKFNHWKRQARGEKDWLRQSEKTMKPHPGTL
jgi:hypothetical protein